MARKIAGSLLGLTLDGIPFTPNSEADINEMGSGTETTAISTSGANAFSKVKRAETREDVGITADADERILLEELADRLDPFPMSYTDASENVYTAVGLIEFVNRQTATNLSVINMIPQGKWEPFVAS